MWGRCFYSLRWLATRHAKHPTSTCFFDLDRPAGFTLFDLVALRERLEGILGASVDVMSRNGIHPRRRPRIEAAAVRVF